MTTPHDLLIVGAGHLGQRIAASWRALHPQAHITAETLTPQRHDALRALGLTPRLRHDPPPNPTPYVVFCAPPSKNKNHAHAYAQEAHRAASLALRRALFTSSTGVYAEDDGGPCLEDSPLDASPRAARLLQAEAATIDHDGVVVRLSGLYCHARGPHRVYLRTPQSPRRPDGLVNLIHYDDAASLCVAALHHAPPRATLLGCDDAPITRATLARLTFDAPRYRDAHPRHLCAFTASDGPLGRRCDNAATRALLGWAPRWPLFQAWILSDG